MSSLLYDFAPFFKAGDSDLENLLEDLREVTEETAVTATRDTSQPTHKSSKDLREVREETTVTATRDTSQPTRKSSEDLQLSGKEFASFIQDVELSDVVHVPSSLTTCEPVSRSRKNSLGSDEDVLIKGNVYNKKNRLLSMPCTRHLSIQRPSSVNAPHSRSHVSNCFEVVLNLSDMNVVTVNTYCIAD